MNLDPEMILKSYLDSNSVPHSLIFIGCDPEMLLESSKSFAKEVLIQSDSKESHSFKIDNESHPDFHFINPQSKTGFYSIEQIKKLSAQSHLFPNESKKQFFILKYADRMADAAANALLKTLEEPTKHSIFILLVQNIDQMLPTIVSRAQRIYFQQEEVLVERPYQKELGALLEKGFQFTYNDVALACEKIQKAFDKFLVQAKKEGDPNLFLNKETFTLLTQIEKWYQKHLTIFKERKVPEKVFFKKLDQAKTALERSMKLSTCLEFLLITFVP